MANHADKERRKYPRITANFVISYRIKERPGDYDLSQTKNISQGGMLLTTNKPFKKGICLAMYIRFPLIPQKITVTCEVVNSKEIVRDLIYETRLKYLDLNEDFFLKLGEFIQENLR